MQFSGEFRFNLGMRRNGRVSALQSNVLKINQAEADAWETTRSKLKKPQPSKVGLVFQMLNFGDGTGYANAQGQFFDINRKVVREPVLTRQPVNRGDDPESHGCHERCGGDGEDPGPNNTSGDAPLHRRQSAGGADADDRASDRVGR